MLPAGAPATHRVAALPPPYSPGAAPIAWIHVSGASRIGPVVEGGRLVLMGGRRAIVSPSGEVRPEKIRAPEALLSVVEAVTKSGQRVTVAASKSWVHRFEDPLGAPVLLAQLTHAPLARAAQVELAATTPGKVLVWIADHPPMDHPAPDRFFTVDLETGETATAAAASWPVAAVAAAPSPGQTPTLAWLERTGTDPVATAVSSGALLDDGLALITSGAALATVELPAGRVLEIKDLGAPDSTLSTCRPVRAGDRVWVVCTMWEHATANVRAFRMVSSQPLVLQPLDWTTPGSQPQVVRPARNGSLFFHTSEGAVLLTPFGAKALPWPTADTRQDPGKWDKPTWFISADNVLPLSDGSTAFLRVKHVDNEVGLLFENGTERIVARLPPEWRPIRLVTEDEPSHVRILGWSADRLPQTATVSLAGGAVTMEPIRGLPCPRDECGWHLEIDELRGLGLRLSSRMADTGPRGPETLSLRLVDAAVTRDGGRSWSPLKIPVEALGAAPMLVSPEIEGPAVRVEVTEVGMRVGRMARIGWRERDDAAAGEP